MTFIDNRGRLFGRLNIIDAAIASVALLLIPLAYGALVLFRTPTPQITALEPSRGEPGVETQVIMIGQDLRPYLRVEIGSETVTVLFENAERAELQVPALTTGVYDLVLYDEAQEVARLASALTVQPKELPPEVQLRVAGGFTGLDSDEADALAAGLASREGEDKSWGAVLAVQPPEPDYVRLEINPEIRVPLEGVSRVGAVLLVRCTLVGGQCLVGGAPIAQGGVIPMPDAASADPGRTRGFLVEQVISRTPSPQITESEPTRVTLGETASVTVQGERFHPLLEATVGGQPATFVFDHPEQSAVELPALGAGVYDLVFYDEGDEVARLSEALTVEFAAAAEVRVAGGFTGLELDEARALRERLDNRKGEQAPWGTIVDLQPPTEDWVSLPNGAITPLEGRYRIGALLRLRCRASGVECRIGDAVIATGETVPIPEADGTPPEGGADGFLVDQIISRTPSPRIASSEPARVTLGETVSVTVRGERFHPFLTATIGGQPATFVFESPAQGVVELPVLSVGVHDVVFYDEGDVVARRSEALTVEPPRIASSEPARVTLGETVSVTVQGEYFHPLLTATIGEQPATFVFESPAQSAVELPALSAGVYDLVLYYEGDEVARLSEALTVEALMEIRLRVATRPEIVGNLERDRSGRDVSPLSDELRPALLSYEILGEFTGDDGLTDRLQGQMTVVMVVASVPATRRSDGWYSGSQLLRIGIDFDFALSSYTLRGMLVDMQAAN